MPTGWQGSTRRQRLPTDWPKLRRRVLIRDGHRCTWRVDGEPCNKPATDVDHIIPNDDHSERNLRSLCAEHHRRKSSHEGGMAHARQRAARRRPQPRHPGLT